MYPNFLYQYALELQREREKELLNLTEEQRLIRRAKLVTNPYRSMLPKINLDASIQTIVRNLFRPKKMAEATSKAERVPCASCESLQQPVC